MSRRTRSAAVFLVVGPLVLQPAGCGAARPEAAARDRQEAVADVVTVQATGEPGAYRLAVGIRSPDTGCGQYADWWEVVGLDGRLVHRRVLRHSHVGEQPFVRAGGPVAVAADTEVWVRAHMHPGGYGGVVFRGSVSQGFRAAEPEAGFAADLAVAPPRPPECAF